MMAAVPRPQRGMTADNGSAGTLTRHTASTDGARPKHGGLVRREYGLLAPTGTAVDMDDTGDLGSEDGHEAIRGLDGKDKGETEEGGETQQRGVPVCGIRGARDEGQRPPKRSHTINACSRQGGGRREGPPTQQRAHTARSQVPGGDLQTRQRAPLAQG